MIRRNLYDIAFSDRWGRQMRFITGPRQVGKTTIARQKLSDENSGQLYYLWDLRSIRQRYKANELFFKADAMDSSQKLWVCFDETHKMPKWKNILKAAFDETSDKYQVTVHRVQWSGNRKRHNISTDYGKITSSLGLLIN